MRIDSLGRTVSSGGAQRSGGSTGAFRLTDTSEAGPARQAAPLRAAPGLDALMMLQAVEPETQKERRKREVARGRGLLDVLDAMKIALIDGRDDPAALKTLVAQLADRRATGEPGLDAVIDAIELRAKVELAKRGA